jgi:hypothetical protein
MSGHAAGGVSASVADAMEGEIKHKICEILQIDEPRVGQVKAVKRLLQGLDTVLVAATGYGKSAVFYACGAISKKITIMIVPLTKLGKNQHDDIAAKVPGSKPVWIDSDTPLRVSALFTLPLSTLTDCVLGSQRLEGRTGWPIYSCPPLPRASLESQVQGHHARTGVPRAGRPVRHRRATRRWRLARVPARLLLSSFSPVSLPSYHSMVWLYGYSRPGQPRIHPQARRIRQRPASYHQDVCR